MIILAKSRIAEIGMQFQHPPEGSTNFLSLVVIVCVPVFVSILVFGLYQWRTKPEIAYCKPTEIFVGLCEAHNICNLEKKTLLQMAACVELEQPAILFTNQNLFDQGMEAGELSSKQQAGMVEIRNRLFTMESESVLS